MAIPEKIQTWQMVEPDKTGKDQYRCSRASTRRGSGRGS